MSAAFDTLRIARDLEAAGVERRQAEAHAEALRIVADSARADLATKADLEAATARLETRLRKDLATKADLAGFATKADLAKLETSVAAIKAEFAMVRWFMGSLAAFVFAIGLGVFGLIQAAKTTATTPRAHAVAHGRVRHGLRAPCRRRMMREAHRTGNPRTWHRTIRS